MKEPKWKRRMKRRNADVPLTKLSELFAGQSKHNRGRQESQRAASEKRKRRKVQKRRRKQAWRRKA